jgi:hypothetical protein
MGRSFGMHAGMTDRSVEDRQDAVFPGLLTPSIAAGPPARQNACDRDRPIGDSDDETDAPITDT